MAPEREGLALKSRRWSNPILRLCTMTKTRSMIKKRPRTSAVGLSMLGFGETYDRSSTGIKARTVQEGGKHGGLPGSIESKADERGLDLAKSEKLEA